MTCSEFNKKLAMFVPCDHGDQVWLGMEEHLAHCSSCRMEYDKLRILSNDFVVAVKEEYDEKLFFDGMREDLAKEIALVRKQRAQKVIWFRLMKTAAVIVILLGVFFVSRHGVVDEPAKHLCVCRPWVHDDIAPTFGTGLPYPIVANKKVFAIKGVQGNKHVLALKKESGKVLWESDVSVAGGWLASDERNVYTRGRLDDGSTALVAMNVNTGHIAWTHKLKAPNGWMRYTQPVLINGGVCWSRGNELNFIDTRTGTLLWTSSFWEKGVLTVCGSDNGNICVVVG